MGEATGEDDGVDRPELCVTVPEQDPFAPGRLGGLYDVVLAVGPREDDDADARRHSDRLELEPALLDHGVGQQTLG